jgi:hypothetical protein
VTETVQGELCRLLQILLTCAIQREPYPGQTAEAGSFPDVEIVEDWDKIYVLDRFLQQDCQIHLAEKEVVILSDEAIQARADEDGDFPFFSLDEADVGESRALLSLKLSWAVSAQSREAGRYYLSGGGVRVQFTKVGEAWLAPEGPIAVWMA